MYLTKCRFSFSSTPTALAHAITVLDSIHHIRLLSPIMGQRRIKFRDNHLLLWLIIEIKILKHFPSAAQKFRRLLHDKLGLEEAEWADLEAFWAHYEAIGIATQRGEWFREECTLVKTMLDKGNLDPDDRVYYLNKYNILCDGMQENHKEFDRRVIGMWETANALITAPIIRAILHVWETKDFLMHPWLRAKCVKAKGCCARPCQCCSKRPSDLEQHWVGHCTPACRCCMQRHGIMWPINNLEDAVKPGFSLRPAKDDEYSKRMMEALVWRS
ncbi:hypothetical protein BJX64DRAFT_287547 [Aspergillus heterothallicus]